MIHNAGEQPLYYENFDLDSVVTPVNVENYRRLLQETGYDKDESEFLIHGFQNGFDIGYKGVTDDIQRTAPNLPFRIGNETILWNKIMKEVKLKRYAGPFKVDCPPFKNFIQSPVGLVPKDGGRETRLIFHLSYPRNGNSVNSGTPKDMCSVHYKDFSEAIRICMKEGRFCFLGKSDMKSAFRNLGLKVANFPWLLLKARSPLDGNWYLFVDKCLPFGSSISCSHFNRFSDSVSHIVRVKSNGKANINYLDDYLFIALFRAVCNQQIQCFLDICAAINFPVSLEKKFWATQLLSFLGLLIDTVNQVVLIPIDKVSRAKELIDTVLNSKKITVHSLQKLTGFLNFLCKCVVPGRAFTRRFYTYYTPMMKPHHHLNVTRELKEDLRVWMGFLNNAQIYCRPFIDYSITLQADDIDWYTDASGKIGVGGIFTKFWFQQRWNEEFLAREKPSIQFQELYAVTASILLWGRHFRNRRIRLFVDNTSVRDMVNSTSTREKNCMNLIRIIVKHCLDWNLRVFAKHVETKLNFYADALSRYQMTRFWNDVKKHEKSVNAEPEEFPEEIWPVDKVWLK